MAVDLELASRIKAISQPRKTREDVVEYYQQKYGDKWSSKLAEKHQGFTTGKKTLFQSKSSIMRRFQARGEKKWEDIKVSKKQQEEYAAHGEYLPGKPPARIHVWGNICIRYQDDPCELRTIDEILEGDDLAYLLETMDMQVIINKYMAIAVDTEEPTISECPCNGGDCQCDFNVEALDEEGEVTLRPKKQFKEGNKGATTKSKLPGLLQSRKKDVGTSTKLKSQSEIIAEMDAWDASRKRKEEN